jgi:hypothetical protein
MMPIFFIVLLLRKLIRFLGFSVKYIPEQKRPKNNLRERREKNKRRSRHYFVRAVSQQNRRKMENKKQIIGLDFHLRRLGFCSVIHSEIGEYHR